MTGRPRREVPESEIRSRFMEQCIPEPNSGCWLWVGHETRGGYGDLSIGGRALRAHRVSFSLHHGPIPVGMFVRHKCDTPACVNPEHLLLGTPQQNSDDRVQRGRSLRGELNPRRKLTTEQVLAIRNDNRPGVVVAAELGITKSAVSMIRSGKRWLNHV